MLEDFVVALITTIHRPSGNSYYYKAPLFKNGQADYQIDYQEYELGAKQIRKLVEVTMFSQQKVLV